MQHRKKEQLDEINAKLAPALARDTLTLEMIDANVHHCELGHQVTIDYKDGSFIVCNYTSASKPCATFAEAWRLAMQIKNLKMTIKGIEAQIDELLGMDREYK